MELKDFIPALKYGVQIVTDEIIDLAITAAKLATTLDLSGKTITFPVALTTANGTIYPVVPANGTVEAQAATATLTSANLGKIQTNTGASGTIVLTLPAVSGLAGKAMKVQLTVAQIVQLDPAGTETIFLGGSGAAGKYLNIAAVIGNFVDIYCDGTRWLVVGYSGVLTKEA